jgi:hypothetical protein
VTTPLALLGNDELTCMAWIGSVPGITPQMVATTLPADTNPNGSVADWVRSGFVTISVVGGNPDAALPVNRPVMQVDTWATKPGSNRPPWWMAANLASMIRRATWDRHNIPRPLTITANGVAYPSAVVLSAYMATAFRRLYDDAADYARYSGDLALQWVTVNDHLD